MSSLLPPFSRRDRFLIRLVIISAGIVPVHAQPDNHRYLSVTTENDIYAPRGQDRHYTNGLRIAFGPRGNDGWYDRLGRFVFAGLPAEALHYEFAFGQNIYTPEYYLASRPIPQDRPYAGWLYTELLLNAQHPASTDLFAVNLGIIGPAALAEQGQKLIHNLIGDPEPAGWDNQLRNEPALLLRYQRSWFINFDDTGKIQADLVPATGFSLGNVFTDAGAGLTLRLGSQLPAQDVPLRILPGLSGPANYPVRPARFDWTGFAGIHGRAVLHNIFLDGNTFRESLSVDKHTFVHDISAGVSMGFGQFSVPMFVSFSLVWRGREFEGQQGADNFGSAMIGFAF